MKHCNEYVYVSLCPQLTPLSQKLRVLSLPDFQCMLPMVMAQSSGSISINCVFPVFVDNIIFDILHIVARHGQCKQDVYSNDLQWGSIRGKV